MIVMCECRDEDEWDLLQTVDSINISFDYKASKKNACPGSD